MDLKQPPGLLTPAQSAHAWAAERFSLHLIKAALSQPELTVSAAKVATEMAREWGCNRVFIGVVEGPCSRVLALSGAAQVLLPRPMQADLAAAMDEALAQGAVVACPSRFEDQPRVARAHGQLAHRHGMGALLTVPLFVDLQPVGAVMFERRSPLPFGSDSADQMRQACAILAPWLLLQVELQRGSWARGWRFSRHRWQSLIAAQRRVGLAVVPLVMTAALAGLLSLFRPHPAVVSSSFNSPSQWAVPAPEDAAPRAAEARQDSRCQAVLRCWSAT